MMFFNFFFHSQVPSSLCKKLAQSAGMGGRETQEEAAGREKLEDQLSAMIQSVGGKAFVKLSTRSPKDVKRANLDVTNGMDALDLLCRSQRIFNDLGLIEQYGGDLSLVVREYDSSINPQLEFRCVVQKGKLRCMSQYNCYEAFDVLQDTAFVESIAQAIVKLHSELAPKLAPIYEDYVIDFAAIVKEGQEISATVIEINPPASSGIGLFKWSSLPEKLTLRYVVKK